MNRKWLSFIIILSTTILVGTVFATDSLKNEKKQIDIEKRLTLLEFALVSESPNEVANTWAKGVMTRNGALQYAVLCDNLQSKYLSDFQAFDWWTGVSSPWINSYKIIDEEQKIDGTWEYLIKFNYIDSTKTTYSSVSNILIGAKNLDKSPLPLHGTEQQWCVIKIDTYQSFQKESAL